MVTDVRWLLFVVAGIGVVLNAVMLRRLNHDVQLARAEALLDEAHALALSARRWQSGVLLFIACCVAVSALFDAGSIEARWLVFAATVALDWKSYRLFTDRLKADVMVAERLRRKREDDEP